MSKILPKTVKVAAFDFDVVSWPEREANAHHLYGECSYQELVIRVSDGLREHKMVDTLLHEIGHAIYWAYGMEDEDKEERIVSTMSTAWTQIFRDSPDVLRFLTEALKPSAATTALKDKSKSKREKIKSGRDIGQR